MRDELFDRDYQHGREALNAGIDRLLLRTAAFLHRTAEARHRVEWSAPWKDAVRRSRRSGLA
jgi:hypothetical protein